MLVLHEQIPLPAWRLIAASLGTIPTTRVRRLGFCRRVPAGLRSRPSSCVATDRLHGDPGLELGAVGASLAQLLPEKAAPTVGAPGQGRCPASEVNDGGCPEKPDHLRVNCKQARVVLDQTVDQCIGNRSLYSVNTKKLTWRD